MNEPNKNRLLVDDEIYKLVGIENYCDNMALILEVAKAQLAKDLEWEAKREADFIDEKAKLNEAAKVECQKIVSEFKLPVPLNTHQQKVVERVLETLKAKILE